MPQGIHWLLVPKELSVTDLNIKFDYGGAETATAKYFFENRLVGQFEFTVEGIQTESDSIENEVKEQVFENMENESHSLNWNYIIFAIIVGIFVTGIILKVSTEKYRSKNRLGSKWKKKNIRRKRR